MLFLSRETFKLYAEEHKEENYPNLTRSQKKKKDIFLIVDQGLKGTVENRTSNSFNMSSAVPLTNLNALKNFKFSFCYYFRFNLFKVRKLAL